MAAPGIIAGLAARKSSKSIERERSPHRSYLPILVGALALFVFRVAAQLLQLFSPVPFLPPFAAWQSGALDYPVLLLFQAIIIALMAATVRSFLLARARASRTMGAVLLSFGTLYFLSMVARFIGGLTFASGSSWFAARLPTVFHFVLASFLLAVGHFHWSRSHED